MARDFGFGVDDLRRFMLNGIVGAFIPDDEKRGLAATFTAEFDRLSTELDSTP
jgi:adenosine deaminase